MWYTIHLSCDPAYGLEEKLKFSKSQRWCDTVLCVASGCGGAEMLRDCPGFESLFEIPRVFKIRI